jgi:hypothetical protein
MELRVGALDQAVEISVEQLGVGLENVRIPR